MKKVLPLLGLSFAGLAANAQIKNADIAVAITSPANNVVIPPGDTLYLSFSYTNIGPDVLPTGDTLFFGSGNTVIYSKLLADLAVGMTIEMNDIMYYWNPTNETITGNICVVHLPQSAITYNNGGVAVTTYEDANAANDTSCIAVTLEAEAPNSLNGIKANKNQFNIFPNPATDKISVDLIKNGVDVEISIINSLGQVVRNEKVNAVEDKVELDLDQLPSGVYFIRQVAGAENISARFTVQK